MPSGADLGFLREGAQLSSGSLKQGAWGYSLPEVIGCAIFEASNVRFRTYFDRFVKEVNKI